MQQCSPKALKFPVARGATGVLRQVADSSEEGLVQGLCHIWKMDFPDISMTNIPFSQTCFVVNVI